RPRALRFVWRCVEVGPLADRVRPRARRRLRRARERRRERARRGRRHRRGVRTVSAWQHAFVATSVAIGGSVDDAVAAIDDPRAVESFASTLKTGTREARARAIAQHLAPVAAEIEAMEATWRA